MDFAERPYHTGFIGVGPVHHGLYSRWVRVWIWPTPWYTPAVHGLVRTYPAVRHAHPRLLHRHAHTVYHRSASEKVQFQACSAQTRLVLNGVTPIITD